VLFFVGAGVFEEQDGDAAGALAVGGEVDGAAVDAGFDAPLGVGDEGGLLGNLQRGWSMEARANRAAARGVPRVLFQRRRVGATACSCGARRRHREVLVEACDDGIVGAGMITLAPEHPLAKSVEFAGGVMRVALEDGRKLEVPIAWFPRLREATPEQREDLRLIGGGIGIHWPQLDEDLSTRGLLFPHPEDAQRVG